MRARAAAEGDAAPPDLDTRRREYEEWATRAGWRA